MRLKPWQLWGLAFTAFLLTIGAWAVASPYGASADERDHVYRAVGVVSGQVMPKPTNAVRGSGAYQTVPEGLVRPWPAPGAGGSPVNGAVLPCWIVHHRSAACDQPPGGDRTPVVIGSGAGRYHPLYYAVVGLPLRWWPGWTGLLLARLISAALAAALLAAAAVVIFGHSRHRLMTAGLLVATTPTAMHFMAAVNPNGVEIAAGIAFFAAAVPLALGPLPGHPRGLLWLAGLSAVCLAMLRPTGLVYLPFALTALLLAPRVGNARALWRLPAVRWWVAAVGVAVGTALGWIVVMKSMDLGTFSPQRHYSGGAALLVVADQWGDWLTQMIGLFSWYEVRPPQVVYLLWEFAGASLLVVALVFGRWTDRWRLLVVAAGGLAPTALQIYKINSTGLITQGRYLLPMLGGLMVLSAYLIEERGFGALRSRDLTRLFVLVLLPIQMFCLVLNMVRWQRGLPEPYGIRWLNPFVGDWHPAVGSWTPLVAFTVGASLLGWLAWRAVAVRAAPEGGSS